jgi:DNA-binding CsgD family transcriptional regulator
VLLFVCAKQAAVDYVKQWRGRDVGRRLNYRQKPRMVPYDELGSLPHTWARSTPPPPIELMIDLLRELLALRLSDAYAWVTCRLHDDPYEVAARELGYSRESIKNLVARGQRALRDRLADYSSAPSWSTEKTAAKLLADGIGLHKVARRLGQSPDTVRALQDRLDPTAKARRDEYVAISRRHINVDEIVRLRKGGLTHEAIAAQLCCSPATVGRHLRGMPATGFAAKCAGAA